MICWTAGIIIIHNQADDLGCRVHMQHNLLVAVTRFREEALRDENMPNASLPQRSRYRYGGLLWTSALRISQEDLGERTFGYHVRCKFIIAVRVICWLGIDFIPGLETLGKFTENLGDDPRSAGHKLVNDLN
jgi:hypothetical protein